MIHLNETSETSADSAVSPALPYSYSAFKCVTLYITLDESTHGYIHLVDLQYTSQCFQEEIIYSSHWASLVLTKDEHGGIYGFVSCFFLFCFFVWGFPPLCRLSCYIKVCSDVPLLMLVDCSINMFTCVLFLFCLNYPNCATTVLCVAVQLAP